jgi:ribosomal protein S14
MGQKPSRYTGSLGGLLTGIKSAQDVNYQKYIKSKEWKQKAEEAKTRAGNRCQGCNRPRSEVQLEAHHRTYERIGRERPGDITVLCRDCHQSIEVSKAKVSLAQKMADPEHGVCIRCGTQIPFDMHKPFCKSCFARWIKVKNYTHAEKHCHTCGQPAETSMARPFCFDCYKKVRKLKQ